MKLAEELMQWSSSTLHKSHQDTGLKAARKLVEQEVEIARLTRELDIAFYREARKDGLDHNAAKARVIDYMNIVKSK